MHNKTRTDTELPQTMGKTLNNSLQQQNHHKIVLSVFTRENTENVPEIPDRQYKSV